MKKCVVLGAGGFIGGHLVSRLKQLGHWVRGVDIKYHEYKKGDSDEFIIGDLRNYECVNLVIDDTIDEVYQLAADMGGAEFVFSGENGEIQDENTPLSPKGFYAITKAQGMLLCKEYREDFGVYASVGILYNHESCLRNPKFLSQKIVQSAIRIAAGSSEKLIVGDLAARVDWGYAADFVDAFQRIVKLDGSGEFIIATGSAHTVKKFVEIAFNHFDLNWREHVVEDNSILMRKPPVKIGNSAKLQAKTGWRNTLQFEAFVLQLISDTQAALEMSQCKN